MRANTRPARMEFSGAGIAIQPSRSSHILPEFPRCDVPLATKTQRPVLQPASTPPSGRRPVLLAMATCTNSLQPNSYPRNVRNAMLRRLMISNRVSTVRLRKRAIRAHPPALPATDRSTALSPLAILPQEFPRRPCLIRVVLATVILSFWPVIRFPSPSPWNFTNKVCMAGRLLLGTTRLPPARIVTRAMPSYPRATRIQRSTIGMSSPRARNATVKLRQPT